MGVVQVSLCGGGGGASWYIISNGTYSLNVI